MTTPWWVTGVDALSPRVEIQNRVAFGRHQSASPQEVTDAPGARRALFLLRFGDRRRRRQRRRGEWQPGGLGGERRAKAALRARVRAGLRAEAAVGASERRPSSRVQSYSAGSFGWRRWGASALSVANPCGAELHVCVTESKEVGAPRPRQVALLTRAPQIAVPLTEGTPVRRPVVLLGPSALSIPCFVIRGGAGWVPGTELRIISWAIRYVFRPFYGKVYKGQQSCATLQK